MVLQLQDRKYPGAAERGFARVYRIINPHRVDYLVVGAFAGAWHGYPRFTADIDFLVRPTPAEEDLIKPNQILQLGGKPNRIDIITSIAGLSFEEAWQSKVEGIIDEVPVSFLGRDAFISNKEATADGLRSGSTGVKR